MEFEWNIEKAEQNLRKHGGDFEYAKLIFDGPVLERTDNQIDHVEERIVAIGAVGETELVVVYTWRKEARRLISARRANGKERNAYRQAFYESDRSGSD